MATDSRPGPLVLALPTTLTGLRLLIAAAFPWLDPAWRLEAVVVAAGTDAVDGLLARRLGATTWIGALLDGVADKAVAVIVLSVLAFDRSVPLWALGPLLARDIVVVLIWAYVAVRRKWSKFRGVAARWPGKAATFLLFGLMVGVLGWPEVVPWLLYPAMACSVAAAVDYLLVLGRALEAEGPELKWSLESGKWK